MQIVFLTEIGAKKGNNYNKRSVIDVSRESVMSSLQDLSIVKA